jgi:PleD family two-component response regulator
MHKKLKILLVFNQEGEAADLSEQLESAGCEVVAIVSRENAIDAAIKYSPDFILLSFSAEALTTCKYLSNNIDTRDIPKVAAGDTKTKEEVLIALNFGCVDFILKGEMKDLPNRVSSHLKIYDIKKMCRKLCDII